MLIIAELEWDELYKLEILDTFTALLECLIAKVGKKLQIFYGCIWQSGWQSMSRHGRINNIIKKST